MGYALLKKSRMRRVLRTMRGGRGDGNTANERKGEDGCEQRKSARQYHARTVR